MCFVQLILPGWNWLCLPFLNWHHWKTSADSLGLRDPLFPKTRDLLEAYSHLCWFWERSEAENLDKKSTPLPPTKKITAQIRYQKNTHKYSPNKDPGTNNKTSTKTNEDNATKTKHQGPTFSKQIMEEDWYGYVWKVATIGGTPPKKLMSMIIGGREHIPSSESRKIIDSNVPWEKVM